MEEDDWGYDEEGSWSNEEVQVCGLDGCPFKGPKSVLEDHIKYLHATGVYNRLIRCNSDPKEIAAWREHRKNKYPTHSVTESVRLKAESRKAQYEVVNKARSEAFEHFLSERNKSSLTEGKSARSKNRIRKERKQRRQKAANHQKELKENFLDDEEDPPGWNGSLHSFPGTDAFKKCPSEASEEENELKDDGFHISDEEDDLNIYRKEQNSINSADESDTETEDDEPPMELRTVKKKEDIEVKDQENKSMCNSQIPEVPIPKKYPSTLSNETEDNNEPPLEVSIVKKKEYIESPDVNEETNHQDKADPNNSRIPEVPISKNLSTVSNETKDNNEPPMKVSSVKREVNIKSPEMNEETTHQDNKSLSSKSAPNNSRLPEDPISKNNPSTVSNETEDNDEPPMEVSNVKKKEDIESAMETGELAHELPTQDTSPSDKSVPDDSQIPENPASRKHPLTEPNESGDGKRPKLDVTVSPYIIEPPRKYDIKLVRKSKQSATILEKLLSKELKEEKKILLQSIKYVCDNNFFLDS